MFEVDHLVELGLFHQMIPVWQVFFFIAGLLPFLLLNRVRLCMLVTYLFTFYLGFLVQWGDHLANAGSLLPFFLYAFSGIFVTVVFVILVFNEGGGRLHLIFQRNIAVLRPYRPDHNTEMSS